MYNIHQVEASLKSNFILRQFQNGVSLSYNLGQAN